MNRLSKFIFLLSLLFLIVGCDFRYGFPESTFHIAAESRLPKWFDNPAHDRQDLDVTVTYYVPPFMQPRVIMKLTNRKTGKILKEVTGVVRWHPDSERRGRINYPLYDIIKVDSVEEVFEKKQTGNILHVTDDQKLSYH